MEEQDGFPALIDTGTVRLKVLQVASRKDAVPQTQQDQTLPSLQLSTLRLKKTKKNAPADLVLMQTYVSGRHLITTAAPAFTCLYKVHVHRLIHRVIASNCQ